MRLVRVARFRSKIATMVFSKGSKFHRIKLYFFLITMSKQLELWDLRAKNEVITDVG